MKNPVLREDQVRFSCIICQKSITELYGRWGEVGGTCSRKCELTQEEKPKEHPDDPARATAEVR